MRLSTLAIKKDAPYTYGMTNRTAHGMTTRTASVIRAQEAYEAKTAKLNLRLSAEQKTRLEALASQAGTTPTGLIKLWITKSPGS